MLIYREIPLYRFDFWGGAKDTAKLLTSEEIMMLEEELEMLYEGKPISETVINDFFWFEDDWIAKYLGFDDFEDLYRKRNKELK